MSDINMPVPKFDTAFQRGVIKIALEDDHFATQLARYLAQDKEVKKLNIFNTEQLKIIFDCIVKSLEKYATRPSDAHVRQYISEFAPEEQVALVQTYNDVLAEDTHDEVYYKTHLKAFIQQVKIAVGFWKIREQWKNKKLETPDIMQQVVDEIRRVEFEEEDILTFDDLEDSFTDSQLMRNNLIPTGLAPLDADLLGGLPRETLTVVLGGTNVGKSLFCISMAANALRTGKKVLHIALEGMRNEALMRYSSNITEVPIRGMLKNELSPMQRERLKKVKEYNPNLRIHNMLGFGVAVEELAAKCREIYKEFKFDMLLVDYSQLLETRTKTEGYRHTQAYVHRALAGMAREFNCVVVTPIQATRDAQKEQTSFKSKKQEEGPAPVLRSNDISEAFEIARVAGVIITLNRTDQEGKEGKLRVFLEKQRLDEKNKLYGVMADYSTCRLITSDTYDPNAVLSAEALFDKDNSDDNTKLAAVAARQEATQKEDLRKKINKLIGEHWTINSTIGTALTAWKADKDSASDELRQKNKEWLDAQTNKKLGIIKEIKGLVSLFYPKATMELYTLSKQSFEDLEKSGTAPESDKRLQKEKITQLSYLFEEKN